MITDLANLGPSLRTTSGLEKNSAANKQSNSQAGKQPDAASSFGDILQQASKKSDSKADLTPKEDVKTNVAKPGPAPMRESVGPKVETPKAATTSPNSEPRTAQKTQNEWDETGSVQGKRQETASENGEAGQSAREAVMLKFMDSMESEFGIPPVRIVEAMTQLPEDAQMATPEDSAAQLISQLDIPEERQPEALALYMGMLMQLQQQQQQKQSMIPTQTVATATGGAAAWSMLGKQERQTALNSSLDKMNNKFFMNEKPQMQGASQATDRLLNSDPSQAMDSLVMPKDTQAWSDNSQMFKSDYSSLKANILKQDLSTKELAAQLQQMQPVDPQSVEAEQLVQRLAALGMAAKALEGGMQNDPQNSQALAMEQQLQQNGLLPNTEGLSALSVAGMANWSQSSGEGLGDKGSDKKGDSFTPDTMNLGQLHQPRVEGKADKFEFASMFGGAAVTAGAAKNDGDLSQASIQQIMKQAQYMIKKGGGESTIQMSPEGLGNLHMKIAVTDGKVNLEMTADTKEAKKALESSLGELKTSLGQHKLTVDQVKVDVGNQLASDSQNRDAKQDMQQQRQMDMNRDQQHRQTREFWSEFQNQGQARGTFQETPGIRAYGGSRRPDPLTPNNAASATEKRFSGSGKGRGLDLVA